jgi:hypothetical protein
MADDSGTPPLPRRVPGATVPAGTPVRVERFAIPEDLRQRVLTAIADELQRDEEAAAQARGEAPARGAMAQAGGLVASGALDQADLQAPAPDPADSTARALDQAAASAPTVWSPVPRPADLLPPAPDQEAHQAAASAPTVWSPVPRSADLLPPAPGQVAHRAPAPDQADLQAPAADQPDPLPRRIPGTNGAPPPPAHVRRSFLPPALLGHRLDSDVHTEPLPRITGFRAGSPAAAAGGHREDPAAAAALPAGTSPLLAAPSGSAPPGSGGAGAAPPTRGFPEPAAQPDLAQESLPPAIQGSQTAPAVPAPAATSAGRKQQSSGRRYRLAGLLVAIIALAAAAAVAFLLSGRTEGTGNGHSGLGRPGAGAGQRNLAAAWVAGQVNRGAVVACDPVTWHALAAHGVPVRVLYPAAWCHWNPRGWPLWGDGF